MSDAAEDPTKAAELLTEQRRLSTAALLITATVALGAALYVAREVALPFVLALLMAYAVGPSVDFMQMRLRMPRWAALVLTILFGTAIFGGLVVLIVSSIAGLEANADLYLERLTAFGGNITSWLSGMGINVDQAMIEEEIRNIPMQSVAATALGSLAEILSKAVLTLLFFIFVVIGDSPWESKGGIWEEIDRSVNRYLRTKLFTSALIGIATGLILWAFSVELAFVFGVLGFLLNFIPTIGSMLVVIACIPLVFVTVEPALGLAAIGAIVVAQNVLGNGLETKMMGEGLDLHPATILIGLGIWGMIWGIVGMLLSAPLMAICRIILRRFESTRLVAELLAGRVGEKARNQRVRL